MRSQSSSGFSFIELMVYLFIIGLLMAVGVPAYFAIVERARINTTKQNLALLKQNLNLYNLEHGKYPPQLSYLVERPKDVKQWHQYVERLPKDGWGQEFYYKVTSGGKHPYELYSYGGSAGPEEPEDKYISVWDL